MPGRAPYGVVRDHDFTRIFRCNGEFIYIKNAIILPKKQVVKIKKIESDFDIDSNGNHTCSRLQKLHSCSSEIYIFVFMFLDFRSDIYLCKCNMYICKNTSLLTGGSLTHKTSAGPRTGIIRFPDGHRPVPGRASADMLRDYFNVLGACQTSYDVRPGTVRCPVGHRWNGTIIFYTKIVRCPSDVCKRRPGAVRAPYGARSMSFYPQ